MDFNYTGAIQTFIVQSDGKYSIECWGASGGGPSRDLCGLGAYTKVSYNLKKGDTLKVLVAGVGAWDGSRGGGGGGSFIELNGTTLLCAAAGGGGSMFGKTPNNFSHGQSVKNASNYNLTALLPGLNTAGRSDLCSGTGGASYSNNYANNGGTAPQYNDTILIGAKAFKNGGTGGYGTDGHNSGGYYVTELDAQKGGFGGGGAGAVYRIIGNASAVGGYIYYYDGAGGGGGYSGGDSTKSGYANTAGGGGSYVISGQTSIVKAGYEGMPTIDNPNLMITGNYGNGYAKIKLDTNMVLTDDTSYYITTKDYLKSDNSGFIKLSSQDLTNAIINNIPMPSSIDLINKPILIDGDIILPSNILDFSKCKLCFISVNALYKACINYSPSPEALLKTNIKVKDKYTQVSRGISPIYLDITSPDKNKIDFFIDYNRDDQDNFRKLCGILNTEVLKYDFFLSFKLESSDSLLKSISLLGKNNDKYTKIKDYSIDVYNDFVDTIYLNFHNSYDEVLVNRIIKKDLIYTIDTLDKF